MNLLDFLDFLFVIYVCLNIISTFKDFKEDKITYKTAVLVTIFDCFIVLISVLF